MRFTYHESKVLIVLTNVRPAVEANDMVDCGEMKQNLSLDVKLPKLYCKKCCLYSNAGLMCSLETFGRDNHGTELR